MSRSIEAVVLEEKLLMDLIATFCRRAGLSTTPYASNRFDVYKIEQPNPFENRPVATLDYRGRIHFQGEVYMHVATPLDSGVVVCDSVKLELGDPEFHIKMLKLLGVQDYEFQIFRDHDVFAGL